MFRINPAANRIEAVSRKSFADLGYGERQHLQEWIVNQPTIFGEELLVIQKEFAGFSDTRERLDVLALDKSGRLVIIENKLDDSGRDVVWQALKYASYCSTMTHDGIVRVFQEYLDSNGGGDAAEHMQQFFDPNDLEDIELNRGLSQRVILVAANFRKEVTSTILWLASFGIQAQCFLASVFSDNEQQYLDVNQIIPTPTAEDYTIRLAEKVRQDNRGEQNFDGRHKTRREFWEFFLERMNSKSNLFNGVGPSRENWIATSTTLPGVQYLFRITGKYTLVELYVYSAGREARTQSIYAQLLQNRENIDKVFNGLVRWIGPDGRQSGRIVVESPGDYFDRDQWDAMADRMIDDMCRLQKTMNPILSNEALQLLVRDL